MHAVNVSLSDFGLSIRLNQSFPVIRSKVSGIIVIKEGRIMRILIVEDEKALSDILKELLEKQNNPMWTSSPISPKKSVAG